MSFFCTQIISFHCTFLYCLHFIFIKFFFRNLSIKQRKCIETNNAIVAKFSLFFPVFFILSYSMFWFSCANWKVTKIQKIYYWIPLWRNKNKKNGLSKIGICFFSLFFFGIYISVYLFRAFCSTRCLACLGIKVSTFTVSTGNTVLLQFLILQLFLPFIQQQFITFNPFSSWSASIMTMVYC